MRDYKGKEIKKTEDVEFLKYQITSLEKRKARCEKNGRVEQVAAHSARLEEMKKRLKELRYGR